MRLKAFNGRFELWYLVEEPSLVLQSSGVVPVVHGHQRFDIVGLQAGDQVLVVVET